MAAPISRIWTAWAPDFRSQLRTGIDRGCERFKGAVKVFFRADDIGVPSRNFSRMMRLFSNSDTPLALAVVPAWLTGPRWRQLQAVDRFRPKRWCWHQHGWRHVNHEPAGKKCEFGTGRTDDEILSDLKRGRNRLRQILGNRFFPVFTPPWNRCDRRTLNILQELGFLAVSRSEGGLPVPPQGLTDLQVHIDLHTRRGPDPAADRALLFQEIEQAFSRGCCGFMLHHRRMNGSAFEFLDVLLKILCKHPRVEGVGFQEMV